MSRLTRYEMCCDWSGCPAFEAHTTWSEDSPPGDIAVGVVLDALNKGWGREGDFDYCPAHLNAARDQAAAARRGEW